MQLVVISAEKMKLYDIWNEQEWETIIDSDVRRMLLNDEFIISKELDNYIGRGAVVSFKKGSYFNSETRIEDGILLLEFSEDAGYQNIISNIEDLKDKFINGHSDFDKDKLLYRIYKTIEIKDPPGSYSTNANSVIEKKESENIDTNIKANIEEDKTVGIIFGSNLSTGKAVIWNPTDTNKVSHTNTGIIGTMGTGKTQFTKSLIAQLHKKEKYNVNGKPIGILIFDYKGDYVDENFVSATDATVHHIYHLPYNPLALFVTDNSKPLLPLHTASTIKETITSAFGLGIKQETLLRDLIMEAYERRGIKKNDKNTWVNLAPTLNDVFNIYFEREDIKEDSLYAAITNMSDFEIFEPDSNKTSSLFDLINGVTVIDLSSYDESIQNLVVAITLDVFYTQMLVNGESEMEDGRYSQITRMVLFDVAENFLSKNFKSLKKLLKEGRMFGVGTVLSTQLLSHFSTSDNDYSNYILTWIVHKVSDLNTKDIRYIFNTQSKAEEDSISNKIKSLEKHQSLVKLPDENKPLYVRDKAFWELVKD